MNLRFIIKLNFFGFLYAFILIIQALLMINVYRLERVTHWLNYRVNTILFIAVFVVSTIIFFFITIRFLNTGKSKYFLAILWIPYYFVLYKLSWILIPITNPGDKANQVTGLMLMVIYFLFPFYIVLINFFSGVIAEIKRDAKLRKESQI